MRTTLNIEDELLAKAQRISGVKERTALVREGLKGFDRAGECAATGEAGRHRAAVATGSPAPVRSGMILSQEPQSGFVTVAGSSCCSGCHR